MTGWRRIISCLKNDETVDLDLFLASYTEGRGFPPYDPRLMLKVLIYGYVTGGAFVSGHREGVR